MAAAIRQRWYTAARRWQCNGDRQWCGDDGLRLHIGVRAAAAVNAEAAGRWRRWRTARRAVLWPLFLPSLPILWGMGECKRERLKHREIIDGSWALRLLEAAAVGSVVAAVTTEGRTNG